MVGPSRIDIHTLTLDELTGVVNLYPWYAAARVELSRRMAAMGDWSEQEFADQALYVANRNSLWAFVRNSRKTDYADKDVATILASYMEASAPQTTEDETHQVRVVGGDYFSQAQYDNVRQSADNIFSRFAGKVKADGSAEEEISDIADRFATETLARIFAEQGRNEEARRIYSRLVLDIPEKSAYFASLIDELEQN